MIRTIAMIAALCLLAAPSFAADKKEAAKEAAKTPAPAAAPATPPKGMTPEEMFDAMFKNMDKDGDGKVSKDEFLAAPIKTFEMRDENKDGFLSKAEIIPKAPPGAKKQ